MPVHTIFYTTKKGRKVYPSGSTIHWGVGRHDLYGYKAFCGARSHIGFRFTKNPKRMNCQRCLSRIIKGHGHSIVTERIVI